MSEEWPYAEDGVKRDEFAESLRLPIISSPYPRWCYVTAVMVGEYPWEGMSQRPTDDELRAVASFHDEYVTHYYNERWIAKMAARPFDLDGSAVGRYLVKYNHGGWGYRRSTWQYGPCFVPTAEDEPSDLIAVMDRVHTIDDTLMDTWAQWKSDHAEVFAAVTA